jgi:hypothetical protein
LKRQHDIAQSVPEKLNIKYTATNPQQRLTLTTITTTTFDTQPRTKHNKHFNININGFKLSLTIATGIKFVFKQNNPSEVHFKTPTWHLRGHSRRTIIKFEA